MDFEFISDLMRGLVLAIMLILAIVGIIILWKDPNENK